MNFIKRNVTILAIAFTLIVVAVLPTLADQHGLPCYGISVTNMYGREGTYRFYEAYLKTQSYSPYNISHTSWVAVGHIDHGWHEDESDSTSTNPPRAYAYWDNPSFAQEDGVQYDFCVWY